MRKTILLTCALAFVYASIMLAIAGPQLVSRELGYVGLLLFVALVVTWFGSIVGFAITLADKSTNLRRGYRRIYRDRPLYPRVAELVHSSLDVPPLETQGLHYANPITDISEHPRHPRRQYRDASNVR